MLLLLFFDDAGDDDDVCDDSGLYLAAAACKADFKAVIGVAVDLDGDDDVVVVVNGDDADDEWFWLDVVDASMSVPDTRCLTLSTECFAWNKRNYTNEWLLNQIFCCAKM